MENEINNIVENKSINNVEDPLNEIIQTYNGEPGIPLKELIHLRGRKTNYIINENHKKIMEEYKKKLRKEAFNRYLEKNKQKFYNEQREIINEKYRLKNQMLYEAGLRDKPVKTFSQSHPETNPNLESLYSFYKRCLCFYKKGFLQNKPEIPKLLIDHDWVDTEGKCLKIISKKKVIKQDSSEQTISD